MTAVLVYLAIVAPCVAAIWWTERPGFPLAWRHTVRALEEKVDELECTLEDEEAAHQETLAVWKRAEKAIEAERRDLDAKRKAAMASEQDAYEAWRMLGAALRTFEREVGTGRIDWPESLSKPSIMAVVGPFVRIVEDYKPSHSAAFYAPPDVVVTPEVVGHRDLPVTRIGLSVALDERCPPELVADHIAAKVKAAVLEKWKSQSFNKGS